MSPTGRPSTARSRRPAHVGGFSFANSSGNLLFFAMMAWKSNANPAFRIMSLKRSLASMGLLLTGALLPLLAPGNAKAVLNCTFGNTAGCTGGPESNLQFSDFSFSGSGAENADSIQIQKVGPGEIYTIAFNAENAGQFDTSASLNFKISPINGFLLNQAQANSTVQGLVTPPFTFNYTSSNLPSFSTSGSASSIYSFADPLSSSNILIDWNSTNTASGTTLTISLQKAASVPGPLPLLGAATAFGFARKLRNRTRTSA